MAGRPVTAGRPFLCRGLASVANFIPALVAGKCKNLVRNDTGRVPNDARLVLSFINLLLNSIDLLPN